MSERPILVVEDSADDRALIARALKKNNVRNPLVFACDGVEALDYLLGSDKQNAARPACVFLDVKMPRVNGLEVLEHIRARSETVDLVVVVLTSSDEETDIEHCRSLGILRYLKKPVDFNLFVEEIKAVISDVLPAGGTEDPDLRTELARQLNILIVDDSDEDAALIARHMTKEGLTFEYTRAYTVEILRSALAEGPWDVILCDYNVPSVDPHTVLGVVRSMAQDIPLIVVSGEVDEEALVDLMKTGAQDVVLKHSLRRLVPAIRRELEDVMVRRKRREAERRLSDALESISEAFVLYDSNDRFVLCNETYKKFYPKTVDLLAPGTRFEDLVRVGLQRGQYETPPGRIEDLVAERTARHRLCDGPFEQKLVGGRWVLVNERRTRDGGTVSIRTDITERKVAEQALAERENFIHVVLDNVADAVVTVDTEFRIKSFNASAERCFGFLAEEVIGRSVEMLAPKSGQRKKYLGHYLRAAFDGDYPGGTRELVGLRKDGKTFPMELTVVVSQIGGQPILIGSVRDLTQKRNAERALRESEERFRRAFETAPHGMAIVGLDGRWLMVNSALCQLLGYNESEFLNLDFHDLTHPEDQEENMRLVKRVLAGEVDSFQMEKRYIHKSGRTVWALLGVSIVQNSFGNRQYLVAQILDLTRRKDAELQLVQAQKMEVVGHLTGGIAHDFNNLLQVILGNIRLLEQKVRGEPHLLERLSVVGEAAKRGAAMTRRLLAFSQNHDEERRVVDAASVVADLMEMLKFTLGGTVEIEMRRLRDENFWVQVDPNQLEAAVLNLATNARDAMENGGTISITFEHTDSSSVPTSAGESDAPDGYVLLTFSDTGSGIAAEDLSRIFDPFFTTKDVGKGSGLGLSMVFGFINGVDGYIHVGSEVGRGTTFKLYLPKAKPAVDSMNDATVVETVADSGLGAKVLVVEDDPDVREIARTLLQELGCEVIAVADGPSALATLADYPDVDLLFTDVMIPGGMKGVDLAERARSIVPGIRVLYTTGYSDEQWEALRDPSAVVRKPYEGSELIRKVRSRLRV